MSKNKDDVKSKIANTLVIFFMATLFVILFIAIILDRNGSLKSLMDAFGVVGNYIGAAATLMAAYVATLLFNDWRREKEYDIKVKYIGSAIDGISKIIKDFSNFKSISGNLQRIGENLILKDLYIEQLSVQHYSDVMMIYTNLLAYAELFDDGSEIIELFTEFQHHSIVLDYFNNELLKRYQRYFSYYKNIASQNGNSDNTHVLNIFRLDQCNDPSHIINRGEVYVFFKTTLCRILAGKTESTTYDDHLSECTTKLEALNSACIQRLKLHE